MLDDRVVRLDLIESFDENHYDFHVYLGPMFPVSPRDIIYKRRNFEESQNRFLGISYSVIRPDQPPNKKHIRAHAECMGFHRIFADF